MSSSSVTKTISYFDSRRVNVLVTNSRQPPPHDDMALRIQQLEQGQQRIEVLMENLLLTLQRPPNDEVPPHDEANGGKDESHALTKKDVDNILAKAKEEDILKEHGIKPPYPLWMDSVPFLPKFKQPLLQTYTGKGLARQHVIHFKILTGAIADQDALKIRLFASTVKGTAFDRYSIMPEDSIQNWTMLKTRFLTQFKRCVTTSVAGRHLSKQHESKDPLHDIGNKSKNLGELVEASMEAETVIKDLNNQKSSKKEPTAIPTSKPKRKGEESLLKTSRVARKFTLGDFMPPQLGDETTQGTSYSCNSVIGFSMDGYESSDTASDTDEWEESLETEEYLSDEKWIP
ncbi:hypothetical protein AAC387_Pa04g1240 [Persea americana]